MKRAHIEGLRKSDPITLSVLAQDLVRKPLVGVDPRSLADLFALADEESLPVELKRDLCTFRGQMLREIADLPDGHVLQEWLDDVLEMTAERVPMVLRTAILARTEDFNLRPVTQEKLAAVQAHFNASAAVAVEITKPQVRVVQKGPDVLSPEARKARRISTGTSRAPRVEIDPERGRWIKADLTERLSNYGGTGLKEAMLIAGAKHRAPWTDVKDMEVLSALRQLEKSGRVKKRVNRWALSNAW
jgi:hypothetical protein